MTVWQSVPDFTKVNYRGPSVFEHPITRLSLFVPHGKPSDFGWADARGWPAVVDHRLQAWTSTSMPVEIVDLPAPTLLGASPLDQYHRWLAAGWAVVTATLPVARCLVHFAPGTANSCTPAPKPFAVDLGTPAGDVSYGDPYPGNGCFVPPGVTLPGGFVGPHPWTDAQRLDPHKAAVMLAQYLALHATPMGLDRHRLVAAGWSAGAVAASFVAHGSDRRGAFPDGSGQELLDTRVYRAGIFSLMPAWFDLFDEGGSFPLPPDPVLSFGPHLLAAVPPTADPYALDLPALFFGPQDLGVFAEHKTHASPLHWIAEDLARARQVPTYLHMFRDPDFEGAPYDTSQAGFDLGPPPPEPYDTSIWDRGRRAHSAWSAFAVRELLDPGLGKVRAVAPSVAPKAQDAGAPMNPFGRGLDAVIDDYATAVDDQIAWLAQHVPALAPPQAWPPTPKAGEQAPRLGLRGGRPRTAEGDAGRV